MRFLKGMILGGLVSTGVMMVVSDNMGNKTLRKKGRRIIRKIGNMM